VLRCEECQRTSENGFGWIALIIEGEDDLKWEPYVVTYCPACAARELDYRLKRRLAAFRGRRALPLSATQHLGQLCFEFGAESH